MVDYNLIEDLGIDESEADSMLRGAFGESVADGDMDAILGENMDQFSAGTILTGKVIGFAGDYVVIDVGLKSEGLVPKTEFDETAADLQPGDEVEVLLESTEDESGSVVLSKRKADRIRGWEEILRTRAEGDVVEGKCMRKIKGGLLIDIGVPVFLPASQVDIRRPSDIGEFIGQTVRAVILKIDEERRNIVISRRKLVEEEREDAKRALLGNISEGDVVKGRVTNIADFGAFIDLGGIDGLLHITDMSWGRVNHPSEMVRIGQEVEVKILNIDREKEKIALGLKQLEPSPWEEIEQRCPVGCRVSGSVVNLMTYGVRPHRRGHRRPGAHLRDVRTRRINHPSECVQVGDEVEVVFPDRQGEVRDLARHEADRGQPVGARGREVPGNDHRRQGPQPRQLRRSSRSSRASTVFSTSATSPGPRRSPTPTRCSRRARASTAS